MPLKSALKITNHMCEKKNLETLNVSKNNEQRKTSFSNGSADFSASGE
jgi:hypothetical protein